MKENETMSKLDILYQYDYLKYQEFIAKSFDIEENVMVYVTGLESCPYEEIIDGEYNLKEALENIKHLVKKYMYLRNGGTYTRVTIYIDKNGIQKTKEERIASIDEILEDINKTNLIGNIDEHIRLLTIKGNQEYIDNLKKQNEYYLQNIYRIDELREKANIEYLKEIENLKKFENDTEELEIDENLFVSDFDDDND